MLAQVIETIGTLIGCLLGGAVVASPFIICWLIGKKC